MCHKNSLIILRSSSSNRMQRLLYFSQSCTTFHGGGRLFAFKAIVCIEKNVVYASTTILDDRATMNNRAIMWKLYALPFVSLMWWLIESPVSIYIRDYGGMFVSNLVAQKKLKQDNYRFVACVWQIRGEFTTKFKKLLFRKYQFGV